MFRMLGACTLIVAMFGLSPILMTALTTASTPLFALLAGS